MNSTAERKKVGRPKKAISTPKPAIPKRPEGKAALEYELRLLNNVSKQSIFAP